MYCMEARCRGGWLLQPQQFHRGSRANPRVCASLSSWSPLLPWTCLHARCAATSRNTAAVTGGLPNVGGHCNNIQHRRQSSQCHAGAKGGAAAGRTSLQSLMDQAREDVMADETLAREYTLHNQMLSQQTQQQPPPTPEVPGSDPSSNPEEAADALFRRTVPQLKLILKDLGLKQQGTKAELVQRILDAQPAQAEGGMADVLARPAPSDPPQSLRHTLSQYTTLQLKVACKNAGLVQRGSKAQLIERLLAHAQERERELAARQASAPAREELEDLQGRYSPNSQPDLDNELSSKDQAQSAKGPTRAADTTGTPPVAHETPIASRGVSAHTSDTATESHEAQNEVFEKALARSPGTPAAAAQEASPLNVTSAAAQADSRPIVTPAAGSAPPSSFPGPQTNLATASQAESQTGLQAGSHTDLQSEPTPPLSVSGSPAGVLSDALSLEQSISADRPTGGHIQQGGVVTEAPGTSSQAVVEPHLGLPVSEAQLMSETLDRLKERCRALNLRVSGTKAALRERLLAHWTAAPQDTQHVQQEPFSPSSRPSAAEPSPVPGTSPTVQASTADSPDAQVSTPGPSTVQASSSDSPAPRASSSASLAPSGAPSPSEEQPQPTPTTHHTGEPSTGGEELPPSARRTRRGDPVPVIFVDRRKKRRIVVKRGQHPEDIAEEMVKGLTSRFNQSTVVVAHGLEPITLALRAMVSASTQLAEKDYLMGFQHWHLPNAPSEEERHFAFVLYRIERFKLPVKETFKVSRATRPTSLAAFISRKLLDFENPAYCLEVRSAPALLRALEGLLITRKILHRPFKDLLLFVRIKPDYLPGRAANSMGTYLMQLLCVKVQKARPTKLEAYRWESEKLQELQEAAEEDVPLEELFEDEEDDRLDTRATSFQKQSGMESAVQSSAM